MREEMEWRRSTRDQKSNILRTRNIFEKRSRRRQQERARPVARSGARGRALYLHPSSVPDDAPR